MNQFIRNFKKQKIVGLLNISSLSLGIMVAAVVGLWTVNEWSFDNFHKNREKMYRIIVHAVLNNNPVKLGSTFRPFGEDARAEFPAIEDMSRVLMEHSGIKIGEIYYPNTKVLIADPNFFTFFSFVLKEGDSSTALSAPDRVIISESAARKYFPGQRPVGQQLQLQGHHFTVVGIMEDMPGNSSLQSDMIFPAFGDYLESKWGYRDAFITFFTLSQGTDIRQLEESLTGIVYRNFDRFKTMGVKITLEPMKEIHFSENFVWDAGLVTGNKSLVLILASVALIILIVSCINFTNLFISTSFLRARNIGVKKAHGAVKSRLALDFYAETAAYVLISIGAGLFLAYLALPVFNDFTGADIAIDLASPQLYLFLSVLFVFTVLLAGTFPALYMTGFNPVQTLGGKFRGKNISLFQKSLIILQFAASIALLITVSFMYRQLQFMIGHDLGFDKENVIHVQGRGHFAQNYESFRDEMLKNPSILDITVKNSLPTDWQQGWGFSNAGSSDQIIMEINRVKPNYFDFMGMKIIEGENPFYLEAAGDSVTPVIVNERALKLLNVEPPAVGRIITANGMQRMEIKGVMRNAHIRSLRDEIDPQVYVKMRGEMWRPVFFKITGDPQQSINIICAEWEKREPGYPFEYHFLDDTYRDLYKSEMNTGKVFAFAMLITFVISVTGLFAMAFYVTRRRVREIALRKVNGATLRDLLLLLNKDFIGWTLISFLIAVPVAYFSVQSWLEGFAVRTNLSGWIFLLVGMGALLATLLTTSFQTWKVATTNPVEMLKSE
jgi:putative ABC transport system permease protein